MTNTRASSVPGAVAALFAALVAASLWAQRPIPVAGLPKGIWPLMRHDAQNTARADVKGRFTAPPMEVWRYGGLPPGSSYMESVQLASGEAFLRQLGSGLELVKPDGAVIWERPTAGVGTIIATMGFGSPDRQAVLATAGNNGYGLFDLATGKTLWSWNPPRNAYQGGYNFAPRAVGGRLFAFPQNTIEGHAFDFASLGPPREVWHERYPDTYWANFGPYVVLADMDNDGREDLLLAGKPSYFAVIDTDTGKIKFDMKYPVPGHEGTGRPYGLLQAVDIDGDGYRDAVMVSCQVEEYIGIVRNEGGKAFRYVWSRFIEHDLPDDFYELRPNITSFSDVNGDGRREMVVGLFNVEGDKRWHTVVFDAFGGWDARLADLPDRYFWGCYDLNGDGRPEIITSTEQTRRTAEAAPIQAVDGQTFRDIAAIEKARLTTTAGRLPRDTGFHAGRETPLYVGVGPNPPGLMLIRPGTDTREQIWRIADGVSVFEPFEVTDAARSVMLSLGQSRIARPDMAFTPPKRDSSVGAYNPLVCQVGNRRELVMARTDLNIVGGAPDLARSGAFTSSWTVRGSVPSVWQATTGRRIVCAMDWQRDAVYLYDPQRSREPLTTIELPYAPVRTAGMLIPYGAETMRLFVPLQTGVHTRAQAVYDGSGRRLWLDEKEGPHPRQAALFRGTDGKLRFFVDNHGKHLIVDEASGASTMVARGWFLDIPDRSDGAKYVLPIIGPFGPNRELRIVLSPGLENLEILDAEGKRLAKTPYGGIYERSFCGSAVAKIRGGPRWDVGMMTVEGVFHSADVNTAQDRWTLDLGVKSSTLPQIASADIDGDGRDNYVFGMANGDLVALDERNGTGRVLWKKRFPSAIRNTIVADLDGDGLAEIIIETDDYAVRVLKPPLAAPVPPVAPPQQHRRR
ncbi:MAG: VCBS repeat-containing protein [Chthonomonadales bacterium]|nr:VCBS repeat-containing protein [Chthonomonadales bacterium]